LVNVSPQMPCGDEGENRSETPLILNIDALWGCVFKVKYRPLHRQERYAVSIVDEVKGTVGRIGRVW
jgi:hypothetical protein